MSKIVINSEKNLSTMYLRVKARKGDRDLAMLFGYDIPLTLGGIIDNENSCRELGGIFCEIFFDEIFENRKKFNNVYTQILDLSGGFMLEAFSEKKSADEKLEYVKSLQSELEYLMPFFHYEEKSKFTC